MLEIKNIHKIYQSKEERVLALEDIHLQFGGYGFIALTGKSGSGKSTLLNLIGGLDHFDQGEIIYKNRSTKDFSATAWDNYRNTYVGFVFQDFYLIEEYTVGKNIGLALELQGYPQKEIEGQVRHILKQVDLEGLEKRRPNQLSGGQKQRIAIARALIKDPEIILCDEPTGNLDSETSTLVLQTLKKLSKEKLVIMVTHDQDFARTYGDRIIELKDGRIISDTLNINQNKEVEIYKKDSKTIIDLPVGKKLTIDTIDSLNNILLNEENDLYLTVSNEDYVLPFIDRHIVNEKDQKAHLVQFLSASNNDAFGLKKTTFSYRNSLKLALSSIVNKKLKLSLMLFLFVSALTFVEVALTLTFYNPQQAMVETFEKANVTSIPFNKLEQHNDGFNKRYIDSGMIDENIEALQDRYSSIHIYKQVKADKMTIPDDGSTNSGNFYYWRYFTRIGILEDDTNLTIIGNFPEQVNDIMITDYMASMMLHYNSYEGTTVLDEIIGKTLNGYTISGIVSTDYKKYEGTIIDHNSFYHGSGFLIDYNEVYGQLFMTKETYNTHYGNTSLSITVEYGDPNVESDQRSISAFSVDTISLELTEQLVGELPTKANEIIVTAEYLNQHMGENYDLNNINQEAFSLYIGKTLPLNFQILTSEEYNGWSKDLVIKEYKIVGVLKTAFVGIIFNESEYNYHLVHNDMNYGVALLGDETNENHEFIYRLDGKEFRSRTVYSKELSGLPVMINRLKKPLYFIGSLFVAFTAVIIYFFISASINSRQKDIGTLRAIGARGRDISKIFITETLLIVMFAAMIANMIALRFVKELNTYITKGVDIRNNFLYIRINGFDLDIVFLYVNTFVVFLMFLIAIIIVFFSAYIPIKRITLMKPINAIKKAD